MAVHYAREKTGAENVAREIGARAFGADLASAAACVSLWQEVVDCYGTVHGLVNNAGVAVESPLTTATDTWLTAWNHTLAVNLTATGLLCRAALAHFEDQHNGRIINIASRAAFRGDTPDYLAYAASKGGMVALTRSIARGFGKKGIKAFLVAPGFTRTDMAQSFIDQYGEALVSGDIALERLTEPQDIAPTIAFLLSGLADHATGSTIDINAGSYVR